MQHDVFSDVDMLRYGNNIRIHHHVINKQVIGLFFHDFNVILLLLFIFTCQLLGSYSKYYYKYHKLTSIYVLQFIHA